MAVEIKKILDFLSEIGEIVSITAYPNHLLSTQIEGIKVDTEAKHGDMGWLSPIQVKAYPERIEGFQGSLLITQKGSVEADFKSSYAVVLECKSPKFAFIKVVNEFFPDLLKSNWPAKSHPSIHPETIIADNSGISEGVVIGANVKIGENVSVGPNTVLDNCHIQGNVIIGANCSIGFPGFGFEKDENGTYWRFPHLGKVIIEDNVEIGSNTCIDRGALGNTIIKAGAKIDNLVHIAHNVVIGRNTVVIAHSLIAGSVVVDDNVWIAPSAAIRNKISLGKNSFIGIGSVVVKNVEENKTVFGNPARERIKSIEE